MSEFRGAIIGAGATLAALSLAGRRMKRSAAGHVHLEHEPSEHGPWCEISKIFSPHVGEAIVPVRLTPKIAQQMFEEGGYECNAKALHLTMRGDGTFDMRVTPATEVDVLSNRHAKHVMLAAYDLWHAVERAQDIPDEVALASAAMGEAVRKAKF